MGNASMLAAELLDACSGIGVLRSIGIDAVLQTTAHHIQPEDIYRCVPKHEVTLQLSGIDPLVGLEWRKLTLPWAPADLNVASCQAGWGVCHTVGRGHAVATNVLFDYYWTTTDQQNFAKHGKLPFEFWEPEARKHKFVPLRLLDTAPKPELSKDAPAALRSHWKKVVAEMHHFVLLGWTGGDNYILLPSHYTALSCDRDPLPEPTGREHGQHYFHGVPNSLTEMQDPPFPSLQRACVNFSNKKVLTDDTIKLENCTFHIKDGSVTRQLKDLFAGIDAVSIDNRVPKKNSPFSPNLYILESLPAFHSITWRWGYELEYRPANGKKKGKKKTLREAAQPGQPRTNLEVAAVSTNEGSEHGDGAESYDSRS